MISRFRRMFDYNDWANREVLTSLARMNSVPPPALRYIGHVVAAEQLWHSRLRQLPSDPIAVWPEWSVGECTKQAVEVASLWDSFLTGLTTEMLLHSVSYTNSKGEAWSNTVSDVLEHVLLHSSYHRGQVATAVRAAGGEPSYTDFIHAVRRGLFESHLPDGHDH